MKRKLIAALVCINVGLLLALVLGVGTHRAEAQVIGGGTDYLVVTGQIGSDWDAVYIIDLRQRLLAALRWDKTHKRLTAFRGRPMLRDFGRDE